MKRYKLFLLIGFLFSLQLSQAQRPERLQATINYSYALPVGDFKDNLISKSSPRGASVDFLYSLTPKLAIGASGAFQDFYQKYPRALYETGKGETTSAVLSNSLQTIPVMAKLKYSLFSEGLVQPYISGAAGFAFINFDQYLGEFASSQSSAKFAAQAGAGIFVPFGKLGKSGLNIGANYNYLPYNEFDFKNLSHVSFNAGIHFPLK